MREVNLLNNGNANLLVPKSEILSAEATLKSFVRQSNIELTSYMPEGNSVKTRLRCSLLNCNYTLQVLQQVATNDKKPTGRCIPKTASCASVYIVKYTRLDS